MTVDLEQVSAEGVVLDGAEPLEMLDLPPGDPVRAVAPPRYRVRAQRAGDELLVRGEVSARIAARCVRCSEPFETEIREPEFFAALDVPALPAAAEAEADAAEDDAGEAAAPRCVLREGRFVDLTAEIRESILLRFPSHPVCRADCRGLCPRCGANLNNETCACAAPADDRWGTLDGLDVKS